MSKSYRTAGLDQLGPTRFQDHGYSCAKRSNKSQMSARLHISAGLRRKKVKITLAPVKALRGTP